MVKHNLFRTSTRRSMKCKCHKTKLLCIESRQFLRVKRTISAIAASKNVFQSGKKLSALDEKFVKFINLQHFAATQNQLVQFEAISSKYLKLLFTPISTFILRFFPVFSLNSSPFSISVRGEKVMNINDQDSRWLNGPFLSTWGRKNGRGVNVL